MMVHEAEAAGISVMAHAQATEGIKTAVRNGVRSIEHGIYLDDEAIEMMLDWGTWLVPTLAAPRAVLEQAAAGVPYPDAVLAKARMVLEVHTESVRRAIAAGVTVAMGTDSGVGPHGRNLSELQLLVDCGMTPEQALHAATQSACELLDVAEDRGHDRARAARRPRRGRRRRPRAGARSHPHPRPSTRTASRSPARSARPAAGAGRRRGRGSDPRLGSSRGPVRRPGTARRAGRGISADLEEAEPVVTPRTTTMTRERRDDADLRRPVNPSPCSASRISFTPMNARITASPMSR